jgi:hypothetical protein
MPPHFLARTSTMMEDTTCCPEVIHTSHLRQQGTKKIVTIIAISNLHTHININFKRLSRDSNTYAKPHSITEESLISLRMGILQNQPNSGFRTMTDNWLVTLKGSKEYKAVNDFSFQTSMAHQMGRRQHPQYQQQFLM